MKRIAIVGAGASGLVTASKFKENYVIFEQKSALGGVWNYSNSTLDTNLKLECSGDYFGIQVESEIIPSALYPNLHTNLPAELMAFRDFEFKSKDMFPSHSDVLKYLESFAKCNNLIRNIKFNTKVLSIDSFSDAGKDWTVVVHDLVTGVIETQVFSHVVICNGHYSYPRIPCISGILTFPGPVLHSQSYRDATRYQNLNVLVVGGSFSALDIVKEVSHVAKHVYCSVRDPAQQEFLVGKTAMANVTTVPFAAFIEKDHVHFSTISVQIDCIIFATGYYFRFPFLDESRFLGGISDGNQVNNLYLGLLHREFHNLAFVGLPFQTVPFMIAEYQAEYLLSLWTNKIELAPELCFNNYDQLERRERHTLGYPLDFEYCTFLAEIYDGEKPSLRKHQLRQTAKQQLRFHLGY